MQPAHERVDADPIAEFIDFGFEECLDSFGAFGLFGLERGSQRLPEVTPRIMLISCLDENERRMAGFFGLMVDSAPAGLPRSRTPFGIPPG